MICSTLAPASVARTRSTRKVRFCCGASTVQSTSTTPGVVSKTCFTCVAASSRVESSAAYTSATSVESTGGPGGISATFADASIAPRDRVDARAHGHGDRVALARAVALRHEIHLHVGDVRTGAHEVVANEPVEVERRRRSGVHLGALHLRHAAQVARDLLAERVRRLERRALGKIEDHLELALVVEGQHLHLHRLHEEQPHRHEQQRHDAAVESTTQRRAIHQPRHEARVDPPEARRLLGLVRPVVRRGRCLHVPLEQAVGEIRRHDERHRQRREHRHRRAHGDRAACTGPSSPTRTPSAGSPR